MRPIADVASELGVPAEFLSPWGQGVARIDPDAIAAAPERASGERARYVLVTSMTPTPLGAGKTTTAIALTQALRRRGRRALATVRQSSLGPTFGRKGGGAGGGRAQLLPFDALLLGLTGDLDAVSNAHNLLAALADNAVHHGLGGAPDEVTFGRVVDVNDRSLRHLAVGRAGRPPSHRTFFEISAASELMAILALADGRDRATVVRDLRARIGRVVLGYRDGEPVTADDLGIAGAPAAILSRAVAPNLVQTTEGAPALVHAGPFANIAHGCSSIVADRVALAWADDVVTEAGFGMDVGGEKFLDIKCRASGLRPDVVVLVATVRALKLHSGRFELDRGRPPAAMATPSVDDVVAGLPNLRRQIANAQTFGVPVVVAVNAFPTDDPAEWARVCADAEAAGAAAAVVCSGYVHGSDGALDLADAVLAQPRVGSDDPPFAYPDDTPVRDALEIVARRFYGASGIELRPPATAALRRLEASGHDRLPVCIAKTWASLSHDPRVHGVPEPFVLPVRDLRLSAGAGFVYALAGRILTMPGLGRDPAALDIDLDDSGDIVGLR